MCEEAVDDSGAGLFNACSIKMGVVGGQGMDRLRCRDKDLFLASGEGKAGRSANSIGVANKDISRLFNHAIVELVASMALMYSCVYVPEDGGDFMKQYVSSLTIFAVMLAVKDKAYFCPDGTPVATVVLTVSGAYTDRDLHTDWPDIFTRVAGQLVGWGIVCFGIVGTNRSIFSYSIPEFKHNSGETQVELNKQLIAFNEFIATFIECVAISFMVMPLLDTYAVTGSGTSGSGDETFQSKSEAMPPKNKNLFFSALSLAVLHYVLERIFRTTMNPFVYWMYTK